MASPKISLTLWLTFLIVAQTLVGEWDPKMDPPLGLTLPLIITNNRIALGEDILLAPDKVLPSGTVLRTIFRPVTQAEGEKKTKKGVDEDSFSREIPKVTKAELMTATERQALHRAYETVWTNTLDFRRAMESDVPNRLRFVLEPPPGVSPPPIEIPDFPDGLLVSGKPDPYVLCVLKESRAAKAGFMAGDIPLQIAGQPAGKTVAEFDKAYSLARAEAAKKRDLLRVRVKRASGQTETLAIRIPPSWNSGLDE
ncbi:MAG: hypothetical protein EB090_04540 [Verrucomicrobia bacterium]|nr:hypothetical protein [Verrucomicrobiota bacterium]